MTIFQSLILGIVEGVTEFLPISSTGHLILAGKILGLAQSDFAKSFEIVIQLGAIGAVIALYWQSFLKLENLKKLLVAFIPTGVIGLALYKLVKTYLLGNTSVVLWALSLGGLALILFERWHKELDSAASDLSQITYRQALWIGFAQAVAIIPGVSRAAATIVGGLILGLKRQTIVEFSFLLAVPTMLAASGLDLMKNADTFSRDQFLSLTIGFVTAFFVALGTIKFLLQFIKTHNFTPFGVYRVILAFILLIFFYFSASL